MPSYFGNGKFKAWLGDTPIKAIYCGHDKVYPNTMLALSQTHFDFPAAGASLIELVVQVNPGQEWEVSYVRNNDSDDPMDQSPKLLINAYTGIGPYPLQLEIQNNTTTSAINETWRVTSGDLSAEFTVHQDAGAKVYTAWTNTGINLGTTSFAATGGSTSMTINVERSWSWNGVGSSYRETSTSTPASVSFSGNKAGNSVSGTTLTVGNLTTIQTAAYSFTMSSASAVASNVVSATLSQAQNIVERYNYSAWSVSVTASRSELPASGGTATLNKSASRTSTPVLTTGYTLSPSTETATPTITVTRSSSIMSVSQTAVTAGSRYQTSGGYDYVRLVATYGGVNSLEIQVGIAANYPSCTHACSGWTKTETCTWPSGAPSTSSSESFSEDCGYGVTISVTLDSSSYSYSQSQCSGTLYLQFGIGNKQWEHVDNWSKPITSSTELTQERFIGTKSYMDGGYPGLCYRSCVLWGGSPNIHKLEQSGSIVSVQITRFRSVARGIADAFMQCLTDQTNEQCK